MAPNAKWLRNAIGSWVEEVLSPQLGQGVLEAIGAVDRAMKSLRTRGCFLGDVQSDEGQVLAALECLGAIPAFTD